MAGGAERPQPAHARRQAHTLCKPISSVNVHMQQNMLRSPHGTWRCMRVLTTCTPASQVRCRWSARLALHWHGKRCRRMTRPGALGMLSLTPNVRSVTDPIMQVQAHGGRRAACNWCSVVLHSQRCSLNQRLQLCPTTACILIVQRRVGPPMVRHPRRGPARSRRRGTAATHLTRGTPTSLRACHSLPAEKMNAKLLHGSIESAHLKEVSNNASGTSHNVSTCCACQDDQVLRLPRPKGVARAV